MACSDWLLCARVLSGEFETLLVVKRSVLGGSGWIYLQPPEGLPINLFPYVVGEPESRFPYGLDVEPD